MDSGLVVVICIASSMIISVISLLFFVKYEWCHVLFKNNTVTLHTGCWTVPNSDASCVSLVLFCLSRYIYWNYYVTSLKTLLFTAWKFDLTVVIKKYITVYLHNVQYILKRQMLPSSAAAQLKQRWAEIALLSKLLGTYTHPTPTTPPYTHLE